MEYMKWSELVTWLQRIEETSLRNVKTELLAQMLKQATGAEVRELVYLVLGGLRPAYDRLEFNLAERGIVKAMGVTWEEYKRVGDLGKVSQQISDSANQASQNDSNLEAFLGRNGARSAQFSKYLTVLEVYGELERIARESGAGSQERKVGGLARLLKRVGGAGGKYIVRIVAGKLRLGFSEQTVLDAISYMESGNKDWSEALERVYQIRPDVGLLVKEVKEKGVERAIKETNLVLGVPIVPALAQRLKTADEMIEKMGVVYAEPKFDGTRVQIHYSANQQISESANQKEQGGLFGEEEKPKYWVKTFTRNLDENSWMFPELASIGEQIKADEVILDSEAVGYDPVTKKLMPFQMTITRKRKHGVSEAKTAVPLRFFVFDIMSKNGESLIKLPLAERKKILGETIMGEGVLQLDEWVEIAEADKLREYHGQQLAKGLEGAVIKQKTGEYLPGRTGFNWVKFKEAETSEAKLSDTIDAIVVGYYLGKGKRQKFGWGAMLVGVADGENIVTIGKVGTGISDKQFEELYERFDKLKVTKKDDRYKVAKTLEPDVWMTPELVVELAADEITNSPIHTAGYALRFPRLVRVREDKSLGEVTTLAELESMR